MRAFRHKIRHFESFSMTKNKTKQKTKTKTKKTNNNNNVKIIGGFTNVTIKMQ